MSRQNEAEKCHAKTRLKNVKLYYIKKFYANCNFVNK